MALMEAPVVRGQLCQLEGGSSIPIHPCQLADWKDSNLTFQPPRGEELRCQLQHDAAWRHQFSSCCRHDYLVLREKTITLRFKIGSKT
mmetsp:Transcript_18510/g.43333  ORF Transcript_18510/g.43333 Transcript_18510/m.43333 type:complete len:88 (+) Transcript_18510:2582-2845(+)